jgi:hypothetical protein
MNRRVSILVAGFLLVSAVAVSGAWKEARWSSDLALDPKTGSPAVYFNVVLEYEARPETAVLSISWSLYALADGREVPVDSLAQARTVTPGPSKLYLMSPPLPVEPGKTYGAHLVVQDSANSLTHRRDFRYLSPLVVPIGLRLEGWDGSTAVDLTGVPDEELEDLVTIYNHLKAYEQTASEQTLDAFLVAPLPPEQAYPKVVMLIPTAGLTTNYGGAQGVKLTVGQYFVLYVVPSSDAVSALRAQVAQFDQPIKGAAYVGSGDLGVLTATHAFVDKTAWAILQAASAEWTKRTK